ncbi:flagellar basal body P-ring protein FlgI [Mesorhizobium sp. M7A.F.Ca.CA.001.09.2.1]|uniref:Flagellar P-ring protein n=6 Tax=Mesorhizobium TaxID=68287 RepID=E8TFW3_MESCW|nr:MULTISPECIES: flagellar basal body P-ring protein FlgI [Mesorhizobium]RUZ83928.1 flagellar basal body P-ring protein FlgI [Mesorhizobium sp. M7A.F.Ca.US.003.02.2.1]ADV11105.1 flagellar P-ring protein [Mesorhizobium ciceri biovar biserrulae WSM1271]AMX94633.1 flagellar biosynthesis protein FlgI [Mesorhizobium ciceri]AMY02164.1 flagellar biosynthesis protein FlgI [Mesorhizobium ciceri biovar biserrulae]ARP63706.1 flagellar biosynthesis protein FlgI [Mesorhizobium sp. WSM1497]
MMRGLTLILAAVLGLQPALADGLTPKAKRELAAKNGGVYNDPEYDPATTSRMFRVSTGPSSLPPGQVASRIKDIAQLQSSRDNQLVGYGLVIGLAGSGDSLRNSPFTEQSIRAMLENLGIATEGGSARAKNVAAVIVTANMPPYVQSGARIDIDVSSMGDATSLSGGTLIMTPLKAADGEIYAVGQGSVIVSGFTAQGQAEQLTQGVPTAGRVPNGAIVERAVQAEFDDQAILTLQLRNPDFSTAIRIADAINDYTGQRFGMRVAAERDSRTVQIRRPKGVSAARFYAEIENLVVESDTPARVVIDERTGTIVIGNDVKISRVAISHGTLTVRITEAPRVVQPEPFSKGETAIEPFTAIDASRPDARVAVLDGPDLQTLVSGLNRLGVKPDGIIAILQGIKSAGALQADLVLQ